MKRDSFCNALESLKQVSENYPSTEKGYVEDRAAHLVNLEDMSARSTVLRNGIPWVHCYEEIEKLATKGSVAFLDKMNRMMNAAPNEVLVLGKYRVGETQRTVVSVGTKVVIREEDGTGAIWCSRQPCVPAAFWNLSEAISIIPVWGRRI